jgi:diguanylate cyclase (GGDEF)-like protein
MEDLKEHNSELLKLLTQHLPDMLWVKDLDGIYLYANQAICDGLLMAKDTDEPIGKGDIFFALRERELHKDKPQWHTFGELCFNSDIDVIKNNQAMKFEEYGNVKGDLMYLEVYKAPFYDKDGNIIGTVGAGRDITKLKKIQSDLQRSLKILDEQREKLEYQANHDALTNLPNRVLFLDRLSQSIKIAQRDNKEIALLFVDLDHFKSVNDSLGHTAGDKILVDFSQRLSKKIKTTDTISRVGGDEFCIVLNDVENLESLSDFILDILSISKEMYTLQDDTIYLGMSMGIAMYPHDGVDANTLLRDADSAMHKAKDSGRNTYYFYDEQMTKKAQERVFLETQLRKALLKDELVVYFQPQMNGQTNQIVGAETLVRWEHPELGMIYPDRFIPLAEATGMIVQLDRIVMRKALSQFNKWHKEGLNPGKLSLNLAIKQLEEKDFINFVKNILVQEECSYTNIEFEVTESEIMKNPDKSIKVLQELSDLGISISIDDFGTGYSSLAYLKRLPIKKLKIDKSFVDNLPHDAEDVAITKTIINLCKSLNLKVIAEGVETLEQKDFLLNNGCAFIQGYFYSKPLDTNNMTKFLSKKD